MILNRRSLAALLALALAPVLGSATGPAAQAEEAFGRVRAVQMSPDARDLSVLIDGQQTFPGLPFRTASSYTSVRPGDHTLALDTTAIERHPALSTTLPIQAGQDQTVVAVDTSDHINTLVLHDDNKPPAAGKAKIRFVHTSTDAPAVDVAVVGGPVLFSNVGFKGTAGPVEVDAGTWSLEVRPAGASTVMLRVPDVQLESGQIMTFFGAGQVRDNTLTVVAIPYQATTAEVPSMPNAGSAGLIRGGRHDTIPGRIMLSIALMVVGVLGLRLYPWRSASQ